MSNELDQLRADLVVVKRLRGQESSFWTIGQAETLLTDEIARLEAEQADPWRDVRDHLEVARSGRGVSSIGLNRLVAYYDHLTAENADLKQKYDLANSTIKAATDRLNEAKAEVARLTARVAEMEGVLKRIATVPDCGCVPCRGQCDSAENLKVNAEEIREIARAAIEPGDPDDIGDEYYGVCESAKKAYDPILDPARVLATARQWLNHSDIQHHGYIGFMIDTHCRNTISDAKPYRLKGVENGG